MKKSKLISTIVCGIIGIGIQATGNCQTYQMPELLNGFDFRFYDQNILGGSITIAPSTFTETVVIDPTAQTIEESGTLTLNSSVIQTSFNESQIVQIFPNPPMTVTGILTLSASISASVSFDTGPRALTYRSPGSWSFNSEVSLGVPINLSYSLVTGGNTYTGSLHPTAGVIFGYFSQILDTANYPSSIAVSGPSIRVPENGQTILDITTPNGLDSVVAVVPEPSSISIGVLGGISLLFILQMRKRKDYQRS